MILPVTGEILPMLFSSDSVNQILPSEPAVIILAIGPTVWVVVPRRVEEAEGEVTVGEEVPEVAVVLQPPRTVPNAVSKAMQMNAIDLILFTIFVTGSMRGLTCQVYQYDINITGRLKHLVQLISEKQNRYGDVEATGFVTLCTALQPAPGRGMPLASHPMRL
jgi:hypothetical protein